MMKRLVVSMLAAVLALVSTPTAAQAAGLSCGPYFHTGFGPVAQCVQDTGSYGRIGFRSGVSGSFSPKTDFMRFVPGSHVSYGFADVWATDGVPGLFYGWGKFETQFGPAIWGEHWFNGLARWGVYNTITGQFYPDGQWMNLCCHL